MNLADDENQNQAEQFEVEIVTDTPSRSTDFRRNGAGGDITDTGFVSTNTNGTLTVDQLRAQLGYKVEDVFSMKFGYDPRSGRVVGYLAAAGEPGAVTVKRSKDKRSLGFHLGHLVERYPDLRPAGLTFCKLTKSTDAKGHPCINLFVKGGILKRSRATEESGDSKTKTEKKTETKNKTNPPPTITPAAPAKPDPATEPAAQSEQPAAE
jgi:hypothetical protein